MYFVYLFHSSSYSDNSSPSLCWLNNSMRWLPSSSSSVGRHGYVFFSVVVNLAVNLKYPHKIHRSNAYMLAWYSCKHVVICSKILGGKMGKICNMRTWYWSKIAGLIAVINVLPQYIHNWFVNLKRVLNNILLNFVHWDVFYKSIIFQIKVLDGYRFQLACFSLMLWFKCVYILLLV